jgi:cell division protein FtsQ
MAFVAPEDRRFHRAQPAAVKRRRGPAAWVRVTRFLVVMTLGVGSLAWAGWSAWQSGRFDVGDITVRGNRYVPTGEILESLAPLRHARLLQVDLDDARARVATSPWIADARVRRVLPSTLDVEVVERRPLGMGRIGDRLVLVDASGLVIDDFGPQYADFDLPIIDGLEADAVGGAGQPLRGARAALASRVLSGLVQQPDLLARVSQIDVSDPANAVVMLDGDPARLFLGTRDFAARVTSYLELASTLRTKVSELDYVDLRYDTRVYVRPAEGAEVRGVKPATWPARAGRDRS